jgi:hypothetical protein
VRPAVVLVPDVGQRLRVHGQEHRCRRDLEDQVEGGLLGKGNVQIIGKNTASTLPRGIAASLQSQSGATIQLQTSDASCFGTALTRVKKANGAMFSAVGP